MSEGQKFIAAVVGVIIGLLLLILGMTLSFVALGMSLPYAGIATALLVSITCKIIDLAIALKGGTK